MKLKLIVYALIIVVVSVFMATAVNAEIIEGSYATTTWQFDTETGALTAQGSGVLFGSWVEYKNEIKSVVISEGITIYMKTLSLTMMHS